MHPADIICALSKAGYTQTRVAKDLDVKPHLICDVIKGRSTSYNVASYLSVLTNIPLNRMFSDGRYNRPPRLAVTKDRGKRLAAAQPVPPLFKKP